MTNLQTLPWLLSIFAIVNSALPTTFAMILTYFSPLSPHQRLLLQCFSLLLLGMFLATLATLNFSLAFFVGLLAAPLSFTGQPFSTTSAEDVPRSQARRVFWTLMLQLLSPPVILIAVCKAWGVHVGEVLLEAAFGWQVHGLWTQVVVWCIWWPAWLVGGLVCSPVH